MDSSIKNSSKNSWQLFIDGASRNNPGPAGVGIYLRTNTATIVEQGFYIGAKTNNQAEYIALLLGLLYARLYMAQDDYITIYSDSELLVRQLKGIYTVKNPELKKLYAFVQELLSMVQYTIVHIRREENRKADQLANYGIDKRIALPQEFSTIMAQL